MQPDGGKTKPATALAGGQSAFSLAISGGRHMLAFTSPQFDLKPVGFRGCLSTDFMVGYKPRGKI